MQKTDRWQRIWNDDKSIHRHSPAGITLYVFSLLYCLIITVRNRLYDYGILRQIKLPRPVISVGNITVGGTGKTPCVIWLAQMLKKLGFKPAVISRGYGGKKSQPVNIVSDGVNVLLTAAEAGDEPYLMARILKDIPVITGPQRILTARKAIDHFGADVIICDDAFQHRQIFRDINILLLDSQKPLGNGYLLPRGELREPVSEIQRADAAVLTRSSKPMEINTGLRKILADKKIPVFTSSHEPVNLIAGDYSMELPLSHMKGKKACAFAGIAKPASFRRILETAGLQITAFDIFPDHHVYTQKELENIYNSFLNTGADFLITTEKDGMRLQGFSDIIKKIYLLRIELVFLPDGESFKKFILEKMNRLKTEG